MRRTRSFTAILLLLAGFTMQAQDTLLLTVAGSPGGRVSLTSNRGYTYSGEDTLRTAGGNWFLKVLAPDRQDFKLGIRSNSIPIGMLEITDFGKVYPVLGNRLDAGSTGSLRLGSSITLKVMKGSELLGQFNLTTISARPDTPVPVQSAASAPSQRITACGLIYEDVMYLRDPANDPELKLRILAHHAGTTLGGLQEALAGNRFLLPYYDQWSRQRVASAQSLGSLASTAAGAIGGLDVTNIADGLSRFIVKRAKTELNIAFFDRFRQLMADTSLRDLRTLFPSTWLTLDQIGDRIYDYDRYLQVLRESFESDLQGLPANLPGIAENHPDFFKKYPWLLAAVQSAFYISDGLMNHLHPGDMIAGFPIDFLDNESLVNWKGSVQTLQLLSESLRENEGSGRYWINERQALDLVTDKEAMKLYMGLVRQHSVAAPYDSIPFAGNITLTGMIDRIDPVQVDTWYTAYRNFITGFITKAGRVNAMISNWQKPSADSVAFLQYYRFSKVSIDLVEHCATVGTLPGLEKLTIKEDLGTWFEVSRSATDMALDISYRNYSCALFKAVYIYDLVMIRVGKRQSASNPALLAETDAGVAGTSSFLAKYGPFIAAMAQAKTSEEVAEAIEAAALPPGSSRIKRESSFNVALNAYVGPYAGYEQIQGHDTAGFVLNTFGITAPVGVSLSRGHSLFFIGTGKAGWATTIFISVVDIGAVASFRFKDSTTAQVPTIHLEDIVSPGVFLSIGIPKWPVSVNFGAQMGPNLRTVTSTANDFSDKVYFRYSASVVVDIPIFNFYTKSKY